MTRTRKTATTPTPPEARADLTNLAALLANWSPTDAGVTVTRQSALGFSPLWAGINQISGDIAQTPFYVYRRLTGGGKTRATDHPAYRLLRRQPNEYHKAYDWLRAVIAQALTLGNHYSWIRRDPLTGQPLELLPLDPERVLLKTEAGPSGPTMIYSLRGKTDIKPMAPADVFHVRGLTWNGSEGLSLIDICRNTIARGLATASYASKFFANAAVPSGVLTHPGRLTPEAATRLQSQFAAKFTGENNFRVFVAEEGMSWAPMGIDAENSQLLQTMAFSIQDAARLLNIPPHRLGDSSRTSYASLEQENRSYYETTLGPWFAAIREEAWAKLLTPAEQADDSVTIEELQINVLRADAAARSSFYHSALLDGWMNRDEVRALENLNPMPDGLGTDYYVPLNMQTADQFQTNPAIAEAARSVIAEAARRIHARLTADHARAAKSKTLLTWYEHLHARHAAQIADIVGPALNLRAAIMGLTAPDPHQATIQILTPWDSPAGEPHRTLAELERTLETLPASQRRLP